MKLKTTLLLIGATAAPMFVNGAVQKGAMEVDFALSGSWMDAEVSSPAGSGSLDVDTLSPRWDRRYRGNSGQRRP